MHFFPYLKYSLPFYLFFTQIIAEKNVHFTPIFFSMTNSAGGDWHYKDELISINGIGMDARANINHWTIEARYIQMGLFGNISQDLMDFSPNQSFPYLDGSKDASGYWSEYATTKIVYHQDAFTFEMGKYDRHWGFGKRAIHISNKAPSYPQFGFRWKIKDNLKLTYFHGFLKSNIPDSSLAIYYQNQFSKRSLNVSRNIAAHELEWTPFPKWTISFNESVIYAVRGFDVHYLLGIIPLYQIENYLGDTDNVQLGCDIKYQFLSNTQLYLSFYMDELTPEWLFKKNNHNWFAWQFGIHAKNILSNEDQFRAEYNWTDHRIYKHKFPVNDFYSHDEALGFWAGPHAEEFLLNYEIDMNNYHFISTFSHVKRGQVTQEMLEDSYKSIYYERYTGTIPFESRISLSSQVVRSFWNDKASAYLGLQWIDWKNAGFNPAEPSLDDVQDISKFSINVGLTVSNQFLFD